MGYREADRVILTMCQEQGAQPQTFSSISQQLGNKTPAEVSQTLGESVVHRACLYPKAKELSQPTQG